MNNLYKDPKKFVKENKEQLQRDAKILKRVFFSMNVLTMVAGTFTSVLVAIMISKLVYQSWPMWYFYASTAASAISTLASSLLNFYVVRDRITSTDKKLINIYKEEALYFNKVTSKYQGKAAEFNLYVSVGAILGSKPAKKAVHHG